MRTTTSVRMGAEASADYLNQQFGLFDEDVGPDYDYAGQIESIFNRLAERWGSSARLCTATSEVILDLDELLEDRGDVAHDGPDSELDSEGDGEEGGVHERLEAWLTLATEMLFERLHRSS